MRCEGAVALEAARHEPSSLVSLAARAHVRSCPHCRRELADQRRLRGDLHALAPRPAPGELRGLADGLLASILAALDAEDHHAARRGLYLLGAGALLGGLAVTSVGAVVLRRHRSVR